jgi:hypothetical protein
LSTNDEDAQAIKCAVQQAPEDMHVAVIGSSLYKKTNATGDDLIVHGVRWYVEVDLRNLADGTEAAALYRVWRDDSGIFKAIRVELM